jgi:8-amino-7-oxononanoate synthase
MYSTLFFREFMEQQQLQSPAMKNAPAFYRNLEQQLDVSRKEHALHFAKPRWPDSVHDFTSGDMLSLNRSGRLREAFATELKSNPDARVGSSGGRVQYGNYEYLINTEKEIAAFYKAETAMIVHSSFLANVAVLSSIALPGDAYVYDELIHASMHEGMAVSKATHKLPFKHSDPDSLRDILTQLKETNPEFKTGSKSVIILVESVYSMDGDIVPLKELVELVKEEFPLGNAQFVIDEVHSTGTIGPNGVGLTSLLGLEDDIAIRVHGCGKALGSTGGEQLTSLLLLGISDLCVFCRNNSLQKDCTHHDAKSRTLYRI